VAVCSQDPNGRALLGQAIMNTNWTPLYRLERCDEMTQTFYSTVTDLVDYYLPLRTVKRHTTDKPWVTDQFRRLIRCRQNALKKGQVYRNRVQRMSEVLQRKYYARKIEGLRSSKLCNWWRSVKLIMSRKTNTNRPMTGFANQLHDGDMHALADSVNRFFSRNGR